MSGHNSALMVPSDVSIIIIGLAFSVGIGGTFVFIFFTILSAALAWLNARTVVSKTIMDNVFFI